MNNLLKYHETVGKELQELENRVRFLMGNTRHWLSDGRHKESILKNILERHFPKNISISSGFVRLSDGCTREIDILLYDNTRPLLFQSSEFVITTPRTIFGGIEVKTRISMSKKTDEILEKIAENAQKTLEHCLTSIWENIALNGYSLEMAPWFSLFCYSSKVEDHVFLKKLNTVAKGDPKRIIRCVCLGPDKFVRFWDSKSDVPYGPTFTGWRMYRLPGLAFSYFISNMIWQDQLNTSESSPWFALDNKEHRQIAEQSFTIER